MLVDIFLRRLDSGRILGGIDTILICRREMFPFATAALSLRQRYSSSRLSAAGRRPGMLCWLSLKMINNRYRR